MGTLYLAVSVFFSNLDNSLPPKVEHDYLPFLWSDSKWAHLVHCEEIFDFELEILTSLWQALLGKHYSAMVHNCSVTQYGGQTMSLTARLCSQLLGQAQDGVAQWIQGARGLAVGVRPRIPTTDYMGCATRGGPAHKTKPCGARRCSACPARHWEDILKIRHNLLEYVKIP